MSYQSCQTCTHQKVCIWNDALFRGARNVAERLGSENFLCPALVSAGAFHVAMSSVMGEKCSAYTSMVDAAAALEES